MGVFGAITSAVNHAWGAEQPYGFLKHKVVAFVMMLAAGLLAVTALLLVGAVRSWSRAGSSRSSPRCRPLRQLSGFVLRNRRRRCSSWSSG